MLIVSKWHFCDVTITSSLVNDVLVLKEYFVIFQFPELSRRHVPKITKYIQICSSYAQNSGVLLFLGHSVDFTVSFSSTEAETWELLHGVEILLTSNTNGKCGYKNIKWLNERFFKIL